MALTRTRVWVEGAAESVERFLEALAAEAHHHLRRLPA
jgi:hypothetical protein